MSLRGLLAVLIAAPLLASGCGSEPGPDRQGTPVAAGVQRAELDWVERFPETGPALVFTTTAFAVTADGWNADVAIENETGISWELGSNAIAVEQAFGVMLFETGELDEVERRNADSELPGLRAARTFSPALPLTLAPGERWEGTISAPGSLGVGRFVRIVFGALTAVGDPPEGLERHVVWITDGAYRLR